MPDQDARIQALDLSHSVCIRAPAGSGKTGLLIQRMLAALGQATSPEAVLAITFTRKAAAEIRHRLVEALSLAEQPRPGSDEHAQRSWDLAHAVLARDQQLHWGLRDNPNRLRATTIDGLNREFAARMPVLSGLGSIPEPADDPWPLYREAVLASFAKLERSRGAAEFRTALSAVLALGQNRLDRLMEALCQMLATREHWLGACLQAAGDVPGAAEQVLRLRIEAALTALDQELPRAARSEWLACLHALAAEGVEAWAPLQALHGWPATLAEQLESWQCLAQSLLTQQGEWRKPRGLKSNTGFPAGLAASKTAQALLEEFAASGPGVAARLQALRALPLGYPASLASLSQALSQVLLDCCAELKLVFAAHQQADYPELALAARMALNETSSGVEEREDARLSHLLVDEMQDTSEAQIELLRLLVRNWSENDGRSLFLVGDPQQSIYLFRQAKVELFQGILQHGRLGPVPLRVLTLQRNFRSRPALVDWCNQSLGRLFATRAGAIDFAPSQAHRAATTNSGVTIHTPPDREAEGAAACALISAELQIDPGAQIAVLARSRGHFTPLIRALKQAGIRFAGQDLDPLADTPAVRDFLAVVFALRHAADDLAWMRLLRSPGVGLGWADLDQLAARLPGALWSQRARRGSDALSADGQSRLRRLQAVLDELDNASPNGRDLPWAAARLHAQLGMRQALAPTAQVDLRRVELLLHQHCVAGRLEDEVRFRRALEKLYSSPQAASVELMTVHKAKGLEFDRVILVGCNAAMRRGDAPMLRHLELDGHWLLAPKPAEALRQDTAETRVYRMLESDAKVAEQAESLRLLYVAATRAREHLDVFLSPASKTDERSFGSLLKDLGLQAPAADKQESDGPRWIEVRHPALPLSAMRPATSNAAIRPSPASQRSPSQLGLAERDPISLSGTHDRLEATLIGTMLHETLERIASTGWPQDEPAREALRRPLAAGLARRGLPAGRIEPASAQVLELVATAQRGWGRWLLAARSWAANEYAITGHANGIWESAIIDRCFEDEQGRVWVVDYKSNRPPSADPDQLADWLPGQCAQYEPQLTDYVRLLQALRPDARLVAALYFVACDRLLVQTAAGSWRALSDQAELGALFDQ